jgi:cell division protein FtsB
MNTGAKIAIGCGIAAVLAGLAVVVAIGGLAWFVKDRAESYVASEDEIQALKAEVNAEPWSPPSDGIVAEERLEAFLEVRRRVHDVYSQYADLLESKQGDAELGDVTRTFSMIGELRKAQAEAQAGAGMGDEEYGWLAGQVYRSVLASELETNTGETSASAAVEQAIRALEQQLESSGDLPAEQRDALRAQIEKLRDGAAESAQQLEVPEENVELMRRYRGQIDRYAMPGLELLPL